jgi:hypothetical protein
MKQRLTGIENIVNGLNDTREMEEHLTQLMQEKATNVLDEIITEGLRLKGFVFDNKFELASFIVDNCRAYSKGDTTTYLVCNDPFLAYRKENSITISEDPLTVHSTLGEYKYL